MATYSEVKAQYLHIFEKLDSPRWYDSTFEKSEVYGVENTGTYAGFVYPIKDLMAFNQESNSIGYFHLFTSLLIYVSRSYDPESAAAIMASFERSGRKPGSRYFYIPFFIRYFIARYQVRKCLHETLLRVCIAQFQRCGSHTIDPMSLLFSYAGIHVSEYRTNFIKHPSLLTKAHKQALVG